MNIVLIGFMGCGKTSIGKRLAARLGYSFIDTDQQIIQEQQKTITELFAEQGEPFFRALESNLLLRLKNVDSTVVATGGGIVVTKNNFELIRAVGISIFIDTSFEEIYKRVMRNDNRPLTKVADPRKTLEELYTKRIDLYRQADLTIASGLNSKHEIVSQIIQMI